MLNKVFLALGGLYRAGGFSEEWGRSLSLRASAVSAVRSAEKGHGWKERGAAEGMDAPLASPRL